jgi:hypothetical protein
MREGRGGEGGDCLEGMRLPSEMMKIFWKQMAVMAA